MANPGGGGRFRVVLWDIRGVTRSFKDFQMRFRDIPNHSRGIEGCYRKFNVFRAFQVVSRVFQVSQEVSNEVFSRVFQGVSWKFRIVPVLLQWFNEISRSFIEINRRFRKF